MSSLTTTWSPSSFQLRLAFAARKSPPSVLFFQTRIRRKPLDRGICVFSVSENSPARNNGVERRRTGDSWAVNSNSIADGFAGWTTGEQSQDESRSKQSIQGILGVSVAGVILVAGLTFAALSVGKRNTSRVKQHMEPLTTQQEMSLASYDHIDNIKDDRNDGKNETRDRSDQETTIHIDKYGLSITETTEATESRKIDDTKINDTSGDGDVANVAPLQEDVLNESLTNGLLGASEDSAKPPETEISGGSFATSSSESDSVNLVSQKLEPRRELEPEEENLVTNSSFLDANMTNLSTDQQEGLSGIRVTPDSQFESSQSESTSLNTSHNLQLDGVLEPKIVHDIGRDTRSSPARKDFDLASREVVSAKGDKLSLDPTVTESSGVCFVSDVSYPFSSEQLGNVSQNIAKSRSSFDLKSLGISFTSAGIPAPSTVSTALQEVPGKVLVPAVVDQVQGQALAALQALKVIEADVQPGDLCTRREYARWLLSASSALSRSTISKVYPAMYIENVTELAFDDITAEEPDFQSIQGLAEAGLISSKLSRRDMQSSLDEDPHPVLFSPESPLSRQDLVSWKMALERKQLPVVDKKTLQQLSGFIDIDKINPDAWPALVADLSAGEQGIIALSFGYTRLFQPDKPVTKAQAAIALATGEASDIVSEELARIEAESMAEKVVAAHNALVAQVEQDVNASFEKELQLEREKIGAVEKLAVAARQELERLRAEREEENLSLMKERAAVDSEMEVLSRLRREVEDQLQTLMSNKVEIAYEKERLSKLRANAESENQEIARLQYELEVERKALSMARAWAEDEAKRAREQAKSLEEARERWGRQGIKVVVDDDLREEANVGMTWVDVGKELSVEGTVDRAESLVDRLKTMADVVRGKSRDTIQKIIHMMLSTIHSLKQLISEASRQAGDLKDTAVSKMGSSLQEVQQGSVQFTSAVKEGIKRVAGDCREGVEKITQKFKT
ncbi:hypothetical protein ACH5RR_017121 [Cinchona calisaya]|uniref:SLH domain-containing protein n=1 Tax=Cinchona calisaya TaxID=153742 RepID=A0ABD3A0J9_9GENT